jgi:hypothetical protein
MDGLQTFAQQTFRRQEAPDRALGLFVVGKCSIEGASEDMALSEYEQLRQSNIARNEALLGQLGLMHTKAEIRTTARPRQTKKRKRSPVTKREGSRRSSRIATGGPRRVVIDGGADDDDEEFQPAEADRDEDEEEQDEETEQQRRPSRKKVVKADDTKPLSGSKPPSDGAGSPPPSGLLVVERAKTGRSKCRKCMENLPKGCPRVGMQAWIMGRQSLTWSHPSCFLSNMVAATETTGRGRCKATGLNLQKGQPKLVTQPVCHHIPAAALCPQQHITPPQFTRVLGLSS